MGNKNVKKVVSVAVVLLVCGVGLFNINHINALKDSGIQLFVDPPVRPTDK